MVTGFDGLIDIGDYCWSARNSKPGWLKCTGEEASRTTHSLLFAEIGITFGSGDGSTTFNLPDPQGRSVVLAGSGKVAESFAPAAITVATDAITVTINADRWLTGMKVRMTTTGTLPTGIAALTDYFVIRVSATTIKLAASLANALAGTAVDITAVGSGTHTLTHSLTARNIGDKGGEEAHSLTTAELAPHNHGVNDPGHAHSGSFRLGQSAGGLTWAYGGTADNASQEVTINSNTTGITIQNQGSGAAHNNMPPYLAIGNLFIYAGV